MFHRFITHRTSVSLFNISSDDDYFDDDVEVDIAGGDDAGADVVDVADVDDADVADMTMVMMLMM